MACNRIEFEAIIEGLSHRRIDFKEDLSELAMELRYTLNAKKAKPKALSKTAQHYKITRAFAERTEEETTELTDKAKQIENLYKLFQNRK